MKGLGTLMFLAGIVATYYSVKMKVIVSSPAANGGYEEVYDAGLLNDRTNYVIVSCMVTLIGAVWMAKPKGAVEKPKDITAAEESYN